MSAHKPTRESINTITNLLWHYCPNIFLFITEKEIEEFARKAYDFVDKVEGLQKSTSFLSIILELAKAHKLGHTEEYDEELGHLNDILYIAKDKNLGKNFKSLVKATIMNFEQQGILDVIGELNTIVLLSQNLTLDKYEWKLNNSKSVDFLFHNGSGQPILVEVLNIKMNPDKYEKENFYAFLAKRVADKFNEKTCDLEASEKTQVFVFPIITNGLNQEILKDQHETLTAFSNRMNTEHQVNTYNPHSYLKLKGKFQLIESCKILDYIIDFQ